MPRLLFALMIAVILAGSGSSAFGQYVQYVPSTQSQPLLNKPSDYYIDVDGDRIHRPQQSAGQPAGATARCFDGSWSFSQHRQGTCSHHGGVAVWLN
jgi:hypothetical protein